MLQRIIHSAFIFLWCLKDCLGFWTKDIGYWLQSQLSKKCLQDNYIVYSFHWLLHSLCPVRIERAGILPDTRKCQMATSVLSVAIAASCTCIWHKCQTMQGTGVLKELAVLVPAKKTLSIFGRNVLLGVIFLHDYFISWLILPQNDQWQQILPFVESCRTDQKFTPCRQTLQN